MTNGDQQQTPPIQRALSFCACTVLPTNSRRRFSCMQKKRNNTTQLTTTQRMHSLLAQLPANLPAYLPLHRHRYLLLTAALLLVRRRHHRVSLPRPRHPLREADLCPNSVAGANSPKLRDGPSRSLSSLFSSSDCTNKRKASSFALPMPPPTADCCLNGRVER